MRHEANHQHLNGINVSKAVQNHGHITIISATINEVKGLVLSD
jgi:hypothetical protein